MSEGLPESRWETFAGAPSGLVAGDASWASAGVMRCRCGRTIVEDGKGCQWHTAVQAEVLRKILRRIESEIRGGERCGTPVPSRMLAVYVWNEVTGDGG